MLHTVNPSTYEVETGGLEVQGYPWIYSKTVKTCISTNFQVFLFLFQLYYEQCVRECVCMCVCVSFWHSVAAPLIWITYVASRWLETLVFTLDTSHSFLWHALIASFVVFILMSDSFCAYTVSITSVPRLWLPVQQTVLFGSPSELLCS